MIALERGERQNLEAVGMSRDPEVLRYLKESRYSVWHLPKDFRRAQWFGIYHGDELVGEIELIDIRRGEGCAELRVCICRDDCQGRGMGSEAIRLMLRYARTYLRLHHIYLRVYQSNARAIRCYRSCGFRPEARLSPSRRHPEPVLLMRHDFSA